MRLGGERPVAIRPATIDVPARMLSREAIKGRVALRVLAGWWMAMAVVLLMAMLVAAASVTALEKGDLAQVATQLRADFAGISQLSAAALEEAIVRGDDVAIFDVREEDEYAVSRIAGAQRVDPGMLEWQFARDHGDELAGKAVVFYCSVGVRSSKLASRVADVLRGRARGIYNLEGGVFRWHNEGRGLIDVEGGTDRVHPYDAYWGKLVERQDKLSLLPRRTTGRQEAR